LVENHKHKVVTAVCSTEGAAWKTSISGNIL
jgi:hypothetical protein